MPFTLIVISHYQGSFGRFICDVSLRSCLVNENWELATSNGKIRLYWAYLIIDVNLWFLAKTYGRIGFSFDNEVIQRYQIMRTSQRSHDCHLDSCTLCWNGYRHRVSSSIDQFCDVIVYLQNASFHRMHCRCWYHVVGVYCFCLLLCYCRLVFYLRAIGAFWVPCSFRKFPFSKFGISDSKIPTSQNQVQPKMKYAVCK